MSTVVLIPAVVPTAEKMNLWSSTS